MKRISLILIFFILHLTSCAGTGANPIRVININDELLTCQEIEREVEFLFSSANLKGLEKKKTKNVNLASWIGGQLLLFPMLAMDVKGSAEIERKAIIKRLERLQLLSEDCKY